jgi:hypothetical protein
MWAKSEGCDLIVIPTPLMKRPDHELVILDIYKARHKLFAR